MGAADPSDGDRGSWRAAYIRIGPGAASHYSLWTMRMLISLAGAALLIAAPVAARACGRAGAAHDPEAMHDHAMRAPREARPMSHAALADDPDSGVEVIGKPAPAWTVTRLIGPPLSPQSL